MAPTPMGAHSDAVLLLSRITRLGGRRDPDISGGVHAASRRRTREHEARRFAADRPTALSGEQGRRHARVSVWHGWLHSRKRQRRARCGSTRPLPRAARAFDRKTRGRRSERVGDEYADGVSANP